MGIKSKYLTLAAFVVFFIPAILLSTGLSNLELESESRFATFKENETTKPDDSSGSSNTIQILYRLVLIIIGVLAPISIIALLGTKKGRITLLMFIILFLIWAFFIPLLDTQFPKHDVNIQSFSAGQRNNNSVLEERIPEPPPWLVFSISLGLSCLVVGGLYLLWRRFKKRSHPIDVIARETQKAIDDLDAGRALKEGVIRYYYVMSKAIMKYRGLQRKTAMTTREFEKHLEAIGLPNSPIIRLTRLFEKARYGAKDPGESENREAVECLTAILQACRAIK
jgi:hypothetical protein